jgi:hypothetical protein
MQITLIHYRGWQGTFHRPFAGVWPVARTALGNLLRRKLFWWLYAAGLLIFLMFFFGTFLLDWAESQVSGADMSFTVDGQQKAGSNQILRVVRDGLKILNGSRETFRYFFFYQGAMLMVVLALAGSVLVGNDFHFGTLPFYLSKPLSRWHYVLGKCLAVGIVVNLLTTLPALVLYAQHGLDDWAYLTDANYFRTTNTGQGPAGLPLLLGILGYGLVLTAFLSVLLVAVASWVRRTVPMVMVWTSVFLFFRLLATVFVDGLDWDEHWRLIDLWNNLYLVGCACLGYPNGEVKPQPQPQTWEAALVLGGVWLICLIYLNLRTRAVEIVK